MSFPFIPNEFPPGWKFPHCFKSTFKKMRDAIRREQDFLRSHPDPVRGTMDGKLYDRNAIFANTILNTELSEVERVLGMVETP